MKEKKIFVIQKLHDLIGKTGGFRIPLNVKGSYRYVKHEVSRKMIIVMVVILSSLSVC